MGGVHIDEDRSHSKIVGKDVIKSEKTPNGCREVRPLTAMYKNNKLEFGTEAFNICSDSVLMHILFKRPSKSLSSEMENRKSVG